MLKRQPIRLILCAALSAAVLQAQTHRVEAPQKVTRAVGVYEWTGDLAKPDAARLVPVSVFIEGAFQDGGTYYARPIPLAVLNGNIYSLEKAGLPQGNVTLSYARHLQPAATGTSETTDTGWFGYGTFAALPVARKSVALKAVSEPSAIVSSKDPDRPTFVRRNTDTAATPASGGRPTSPSTTADANSTPDDPDRPHLSKAPTAATTPPPDPSDPKPSVTSAPDATPTTASPTKPTTTTDDSKDPANDSDRPTLRRRNPKQAEADRKANTRSSVTGMPGSLNDDPDRPNMRRGATTGAGSAAPQLTGVPAALHQMVAVSDPATREPHPFAREWSTPTERADTLAKLEVIAQQQLANYASANGGAPQPPPPAPTPKPGPGTRVRRTPLSKPAAPVAAPLSSEEVTPYTLSYGGLPTFVYTATSTPAAVPAAGPSIPERYIMLVAQQVPSGELQLAFSSVTDAAHLDRTPWFRLVDAVDPDAGHRASLLFELRGQTSRQFGLYRILSAKAEQIFVTNPTN